ncbi:tRNA (adenosine(37)-N6)-threonylcarbamoyltransferase complex dimerization subunit type 1 TsaB [Candidatus Dojkabacteria bacterium]|nr:tRNA (adenosine(37)-N6)-threonylcarbamoyltransferase complex dimerization subunit type 1 TsaB [Candidatus Dojkabacteria bacterium]
MILNIKYLLAIQTAEFPNSVALFNEKGGLVDERVIEVKGKSEKLLGEMTKDLIKKNGITFDSIQTLAVCLGPGSYTGLRAGVAFAKGLCQFSGIRLVGVDIFEAFDEKGIKDGIFLLDAKNRRVYYKIGDKIKVNNIEKALVDLEVLNEPKTLDEAKALNEPKTLDEPKVNKTKLFGNGAKENESFIAGKLGKDIVSNISDENLVNAEFIGRAALKKKRPDSVFELKPIYVQEANITIKNNAD